MPRSFFSMYCSANAISGFWGEKDRAEQILTTHLPDVPGIVMLALEDDDWVYGQASFPRPGLEAARPFKFLDRFATIVSNQVLDVLKAEGDPAAILFVDPALIARFEAHPSFARVSPLFRQVSDFRPPTTGAGAFAAVGGIAQRIIANTPLPTTDTNAVRSARDGLELWSRLTGDQEDLKGLLYAGLALYHYCALDTYVAKLEERVAAAPDDVVGRTALALVLHDLGDHSGALPHARIAAAKADASPEAFLALAKAAWRAREPAEGLVALAQLSPPEDWRPPLRSGLLSLHAALLSQQGDHAAAADALSAAIELDGAVNARHLALAAERLAAKRPAEARAAAETAMVLSPEDSLVQAEVCRALQATGDTAALQRALRRLSATPAGRLEARRFPASADLAGAEPVLGDLFEAYDLTRREAILAASLPTWLDLCRGSTVFTFYNAWLESDHRGQDEPARSFSPSLMDLASDRLDGAAHASMAAVWIQLSRPEVAVSWARGALALKPDNPTYHFILAVALKGAGQASEAFDATKFAMDLGCSNDACSELYSSLLWSVPRVDMLSAYAASADGLEPLRRAAESRLTDPDERPGALWALSFIALQADDPKAIDLQREGLALQPERDDLYDFLVVSLRRFGREAEADEALETQAAAFRATVPNVTAAQFGGLAEGALDNNLGGASKITRAGLQLDPGSPSLRLSRARLAIAQGSAEAAIDDLREIAFSDAACAARAAEVLGDALSDAKRRVEALEVWARLRELEPQNADGYLGAGRDLWLLEREVEAEPLVARSVKLDPDRRYAWGLLGRIRRALGQKAEALIALERAMDFDPPPVNAIRAYAGALIDVGRAPEASAKCESLLAQEPGHFEAAAGCVEAFAATGEKNRALDTALGWLEAADPGASSDAFSMRRAIKLRVGAAAAVRFGEAAVRHWPDDVELLREQALGCVRMARYDEAETLGRRTLELAPSSFSALQCWARILSLQDFVTPEAARELADRLQAADASSTALPLIGDLLRAANLDARPMFERAVQAYDARPIVDQHMVGWCLLHLGRLDEAAERLRRRLTDAPNDEGAMFDAAVIGFLADDGPQSRSRLDDAFRAAHAAEWGIGLVEEDRRVARQWRRQGVVAPPERLAALVEIFEAAAEGQSVDA